LYKAALALLVLGGIQKNVAAGDVTGNGLSKLVFTILSAVAEADQRRRNRYLGGIVPFGWRLGENG
jgi:hypothetical protein